LEHDAVCGGGWCVRVGTEGMMTGILLDKLLLYYTDLYPTELNHNQQLANPNTLRR
jgi:hypothetical protein